MPPLASLQQTSLSSASNNLSLWMKRGRLPLAALRSHEVAGRPESFTLAAQELFISEAAVSRQIRDLEDVAGLSALRAKPSERPSHRSGQQAAGHPDVIL
ncbi:LysR family transcriptional regulator [Rhizobium leguminosarum]|uniref:LysR family transcriptional regulator n=1 Tax=Rhizobium leguminosarum TaxID=384 RepID=UPI00396584F0